MSYTPLNYQQINALESQYHPNSVLPYNNEVYDFWMRSLFQRATSVFDITLPEDWQGNVKDFFIYCLFRFGFLAVFNTSEYGTIFQPATLNGFNLYYQPTTAIISNPALDSSLNLTIGSECELIKLTPDYMGIWDIISYYAEKLATLDNAINMNIINSKFAYIVGAKNKSAAATIKKLFDKINHGEPAVFFDSTLVNDQNDKAEPWQFLERTNLKASYLTDTMLQDFQTLINNFDAEVGIPTIPYAKKERMVTSEADSREIDSTSRSIIWKETLDSSIKNVKKLYPELNIDIKLRFEKKEGVNNVSENDTERNE